MKRKLLIIGMLFVLVIAFTGCSKVIKEKTTKVTANVVNKQYVAGATTIVMSGKTMIPITRPPRYEIHLKYKELEEIIDNFDIYNNTEIGDEITMFLVQGYSENDELISEKLEFIEKEE